MSWPSNSKLPPSSRLTADVMLALENDFRGSGADAIARLRRNRPWNYLQLIRSVVDLKAADLKPDEVSDDELSALIEDARDALAKIKAWEEEAAAEEAAAASAQRASPP